jgi:penicillin-insensitive murein endopeptidase
LFVGDLSAAYGGKIPNHASHRTGRDVDLLYFMTNVHGQAVNCPGFVSIGNDGLAQVSSSGRFLQLDVDRQWLLVRSLLTNSEVELLWMFVSRDIEALLIEHARALSEPNELIWRAEQVLHQPRDSAPHDDHLHLRIACSRSEVLQGCEGGGPHWPWFEPAPSATEFDENLWAAISAEPSP